MRYIVGVSGASGVRLSIRLLEELKKNDVDIYSVITDNALKVIKVEDAKTLDKIKEYSKKLFMQNEFDASIASSSFPVDGMVVIPCSMNTIAKIAYGIADNLLLRAADIQIKMRNKLVLVPREMPFSQIHFKNLYILSGISSVYIIFPLLTYYHNPKRIEDMENFVIGRILEVIGLSHNLYKRWGEDYE